MYFYNFTPQIRLEMMKVDGNWVSRRQGVRIKINAVRASEARVPIPSRVAGSTLFILILSEYSVCTRYNNNM